MYKSKALRAYIISLMELRGKELRREVVLESEVGREEEEEEEEEEDMVNLEMWDLVVSVMKEMMKSEM